MKQFWKDLFDPEGPEDVMILLFGIPYMVIMIAAFIIWFVRGGGI